LRRPTDTFGSIIEQQLVREKLERDPMPSHCDINERCISQLRNVGLEGYFAVIGSGPSSRFIASIEKLEEKLGSLVGIEKKQEQHFWDYTQDVFDALQGNTNQYFSAIRETYGDSFQWTARIYEQIAFLPVKGFATLNYDDQLPHAFRLRHEDREARRFYLYPHPAVNFPRSLSDLLSDQPQLIALHGYADENNPTWEREIILKRSDYNRYYSGHGAPLASWWREILLNIPCLFIGTKLYEPGIKLVINQFDDRDLERLRSQKHVHLVGVNKSSEIDTSKTFGLIDRVSYKKLDRDHKGLCKILSDLNGLPPYSVHQSLPTPSSINPGFDPNASIL
jgi:hypothetical protein